MKAIHYTLQYLVIVSLILVTVSGIYDLYCGFRAAESYMELQEEFGPYSDSLIASTYALCLFRGTCVTLGCGVAGLVQVCRKKIRVCYLFFLGFWCAMYAQTVLNKAYRGFREDDLIQMWVIVTCFGLMVLYKVINRSNAACSNTLDGTPGEPKAIR